MQQSRGAAWDTPEEAATTSTFDGVASETHPQPVLRSRPIAIRQSANEPDSDDDSSHRDEDLETDETGTNAVHRVQQRPPQHQSLPSRWLLRAPHLGSIPTNDEFLLRRHGTIPEFRLPEQDTVEDVTNEQPTAYGSLRDSHIQGRFLDQPSFMGGGSIAVPRRRAGSTNAMSSSVPIFSGLTIGERIQQQRKLQMALRQKSGGSAGGAPVGGPAAEGTALPRKSSVLAELMGKMELDQAAAEPFLTAAPDAELALDATTSALSSSVTGLAILQGGWQPPDQRWTVMQKHRSLPPISDSQEVATHARLSQSFSSPPSAGVPSYLNDAVPATAAGFLLPPANTTLDESIYRTPVPPTAASAAPFASQVVEIPMPPAPPAHRPPLPMESPVTMEGGMDDDADDQSDMDGAFDLDMD